MTYWDSNDWKSGQFKLVLPTIKINISELMNLLIVDSYFFAVIFISMSKRCTYLPTRWPLSMVVVVSTRIALSRHVSTSRSWPSMCGRSPLQTMAISGIFRTSLHLHNLGLNETPYFCSCWSARLWDLLLMPFQKLHISFQEQNSGLFWCSSALSIKKC